jgi:putative MATE family efflux protein
LHRLSIWDPEAMRRDASTPADLVAPVTNPLVTAPILPTLVRLSLPNVIAMLTTAFVAIAETAYAGRLGTPALAGLALVFPMVMLQQMMSAGAMGGGISSAIARALGAGAPDRANSLAVHALVIGGLAGLASTVLMLTFGSAIYFGLGGRDGALTEALLYSNVIFLASCSIWLTNTLASILRGSGNMNVPSSVLLIAALAQAALSGALALGWGPLPRLGMFGLALGQVIALTAAALFLFAYLRAGKSKVRLSLGGRGLDGAMFRDILKVGAIAVISPIQSVLTVLIITRLVSTFGTEAIAGYGIGARLEFLLVPIVFAIGVASVPMVGMAIGAGDVARARRVAWTASFLAGALTGAIGLVVAVAPDAWAGWFSTSEGVLTAAREYLRTAGPAYAAYGFALALYFATQGSGKILGPVLAQTMRLATIVAGGLWIASNGASRVTMFALVALAMVVYGIASAYALYVARWAPDRR